MTGSGIYLSDRSRGTRSIKAFRFFQMAGLGSFSIFFPLYLMEHGISLAQVGLIVALPVLMGIVAGAMWSSLSDAVGRSKPFLIQSAMAWMLFAFAVTLMSSFKEFIVLGLIVAILTPPAEGLIVTNLFRAGDQRARATTYSGFAVWGAIGWAAATTLAGIAVSLWNLEAAMYLASLLFCIASFAALRIPDFQRGCACFTRSGAPSPKQVRAVRYLAPIRELLHNKNMRRFLLASLPLSVAITAVSRYFPIYMGASGASPILIGLVFTVPAILEIPIFLRSGKLSDGSGTRKQLLIFSATMYTLLFLLISALTNPMLLFLTYSLIAPFAWPPLITGSSTLVSEMVAPERWVTGQTLYTIWVWSIGGIIGPLVGGFTSALWGFPAMFAVVAALAAISGLAFRGIRERCASPAGDNLIVKNPAYKAGHSSRFS